MAANYTQETTEEDASDLCFPKDKKTPSEYTLKTVRTFEKFPSLWSSNQQLDISYLVSISCGQWFMYNPKGRSVVTGSCSEVYRNSESKPISSYQEYSVTSAVHFEVTHLLAHPSQVGLILLWGKHGIAVITLPTTTADPASVSSQLIGEDLFVENVKLETIQVRWLPSSKIVVVLHSDHQLRLYDASSSVLMTETNVGPRAQKQSNFLTQEESQIPIDFDFGPHLPKSNLLLIFVLEQSGALYYILLRTLDNIKKCYKEVHGPLRIHGELDDKLTFVGSKHTSLVVTKNFPIVVTTGDLSNTLQHFLLLPDDFETDEVVVEEKVLSGEIKLYLRERIILETISETDNNYLNLIQDPNIDHRMSCVTETGIYIINVNFVPEVRLFLRSSGDNDNLRSTPSSVQFLVCWKVNDKSQPGRCLAGLSFCDALEQKLLIVLGDLRAFTVDVSCSVLDDMGKYDTSRDGVGSGGFAFGSEIQDISKTVKNMLKKSATQPLMCSNQEVQGEDLEKFTVEALELLVREYIERQEEAFEYLQCSIKTLQVKTETNCENLEELMHGRIDLRQAAESIAEQYDERNHKNEGFQKRLEVALHKQQQSLPAITDQEKLWRKTLQDYQKDIELFKTSVENLKNKVESEKKEKFEKVSESSLKLAPNQILEIKNQIRKQHDEVERLTKEIRELKAALGIA